MKSSKKSMKRISMMALAVSAAFIMSGADVADVSAAAKKPKKIKVVASNAKLGSSKTIYIGGPKALKTTTLKATVTPKKASQKVKFKSLTKKIAKVNSKGKVTAKKVGTAKIQVTSKANKKVKKVVKITVKKYTAPTMTVKTSAATIYNGTGAGTTANVTASISGMIPSKAVTFKSSDTTLATVSSKGVVTANKGSKTGTVTITVTSGKTYDNKVLSKSVAIKVVGKPSATGVTLNSTSKIITKTGVKANPTTTLEATVTPASASQKVTWSSSDTTVATVDANGVVTGLTTGTVEITAKTANGKSATCTVTVKKSTVAVHDPSIFDDPNSDNYYTIGTGVAMAVSSDLQAWSGTTSGVNLFKNGLDELQPLFDWTQNKDIASVWAADMIYNKSMKKYCMYTCAAADNWKTCIAMFSADSPTGPYSYEGMIVCADFNKTTIGGTNIVEALGLKSADEIPERYYDASETGESGSDYYKANFADAIDPQPFYGHDGQLYMSYGSFTCRGGIQVLKLNPDTGLRDTAYNYEYEAGVSDPYFGKKVTNKAGEGPYILKVPSAKSSTGYYYFLWTSSGLLRGTGTYTMSMWRSENPDGPFVDAKGIDARDGGGNVMVYNYKYSFMKYAHTSMGGNSALVDEDGKIYLCYHNKFSDGSANPGSHMVKLNQMFLNEDGWLVMAPFEYHGETIAKSYAKEDVAGNYEFVMHRQATVTEHAVPTTIGGVATTYYYNYNDSTPLRLNADGTVTGSLTGKWTLSGNCITITAGDVEYKGVVLEQYESDGGNGYVSSLDKTIVFTALGSDRVNITGTKVTLTDAEAVTLDRDAITVSATAGENFTLPVMGLGGSDIAWASDNTAIKIDGANATIARNVSDTNVTLTATVTRGNSKVTKTFAVTVPAVEIVVSTVVRTESIALPKEVDGFGITWSSSSASVNVETGEVKLPTTGSETVTLTATIGDVKREFTVTLLPATVTEYKYQQDYENVTDASTVWTSTNAQAAVTVENDTEHGNYIRFAPGSANSRGAITDFGLTDLSGVYTVEMDVNLKAGDNQTTEFALSGTDMAYTGVINDGIASGYIFKLSSDMSTTWYVNGNASFEMPEGWIHITAVVDTNNKVSTVIITDIDGNVLYSGAESINGSGTLKGIYVRGGRYQSVTMVDNIKVY